MVKNGQTKWSKWSKMVQKDGGSDVMTFEEIKLLESPIPTATTATASSQKAHFDNISGTKRGTIDPLVSKRPEKNSTTLNMVLYHL